MTTGPPDGIAVVRDIVEMLWAPESSDAVSRKTKSSGTSGVKVGLRIVVEESVAVDLEGRRTSSQSHCVAVRGEVSSWRA